MGIVTELDNKLEDMEPESDETATAVTPKSSEANEDSILSEDPAMDASFMSESIYEKIPSPKSLKHKSHSMPRYLTLVRITLTIIRETVHAYFTRAL